MDNIDIISISSTSSEGECELVDNEDSNNQNIVPSTIENSQQKTCTQLSDNENSNHINNCHYHCNCGDTSAHSPVNNDSNDSDENHAVTKPEQIQQNGICIRYDFENKSKCQLADNDVGGEKEINIVPYTTTTSLFRYIENLSHVNLVNNGTNSRINHANSLNSSVTQDGSLQKNNTPLSPESRKKEFCSYLQLMNQKQTIDLRNRRSARVKHLHVLKEKKNLEETLNQEQSTTSSSNYSSNEKNNKTFSDEPITTESQTSSIGLETSREEIQSKQQLQENHDDNFIRLSKEIDLVNCPTLKALEALNMELDKVFQQQNIFPEEVLRCNKYFPLPPEDIYSVQQDFDDEISRLIDEGELEVQVAESRKRKRNDCDFRANKSGAIKNNILEVLKHNLEVMTKENDIEDVNMVPLPSAVEVVSSLETTVTKPLEIRAGRQTVEARKSEDWKSKKQNEEIESQKQNEEVEKLDQISPEKEAEQASKSEELNSKKQIGDTKKPAEIKPKRINEEEKHEGIRLTRQTEEIRKSEEVRPKRQIKNVRKYNDIKSKKPNENVEKSNEAISKKTTTNTMRTSQMKLKKQTEEVDTSEEIRTKIQNDDIRKSEKLKSKRTEEIKSKEQQNEEVEKSEDISSIKKVEEVKKSAEKLKAGRNDILKWRMKIKKQIEEQTELSNETTIKVNLKQKERTKKTKPNTSLLNINKHSKFILNSTKSNILFRKNSTNNILKGIISKSNKYKVRKIVFLPNEMITRSKTGRKSKRLQNKILNKKQTKLKNQNRNKIGKVNVKKIGGNKGEETTQQAESSRCEILTIELSDGDEYRDEQQQQQQQQQQQVNVCDQEQEDKNKMVENWIQTTTDLSNSSPVINVQSPLPKEKVFQVFDLSNSCQTRDTAVDDSESKCSSSCSLLSSKSSTNMVQIEGIDLQNPLANLITIEHNYFGNGEIDNGDEDVNDNLSDSTDTTAEEHLPQQTLTAAEDLPQQTLTDIDIIPITVDILPVNPQVKPKSLQRSLTKSTGKRKLFNNSANDWESLDVNIEKRKPDHIITISKENGKVLFAAYIDYHLIISQECLISFWTQSALGNIFTAQNMWIPNGEIQRLLLNNTYVQKKSLCRVISTETSVAYVELWTKEHPSQYRDSPISDVFTTVYYWRHRQSGLDKKALQLENVNASTDTVQYVVLPHTPIIIVSWQRDGLERKTVIRSYLFAADYQTVGCIREFTSVQHVISSLLNVEDCDDLVLGYGENRMTLWNIQHGHLIADIELSTIKPPLSTHWVKCDRGFLFITQECVDSLRLIALNGINYSWKRLQVYSASSDFGQLRGLFVENGILIAFYSQGILCWNAQSGDPILEEVPVSDIEYIPSGKFVIIINDDKIIVKHALTHFLTPDDSL